MFYLNTALFILIRNNKKKNVQSQLSLNPQISYYYNYYFFLGGGGGWGEVFFILDSFVILKISLQTTILRFKT